MQHDNASFWTEIKDFEERLSQAPDSYVFARLSEVYLKVGLVDDALYIARQGVAKYPGYAAGQRSLALACHAKGMLEESRQALEVVTTALPDDREAQKLLGRLLSMNGDYNAAFRAFSTVLEFYPDDVECKIELDSLVQRSSILLSKASQDDVARIDFDEAVCGESSVIVEEIDEAEEIIEDAEILEMDEADFVEDDSPTVVSVTKPHDPLSTVTLANLYVQQGFIDKALDIYHVILADDPNNFDVQSRIAKLESREFIGIEAPQETIYGEDLAVGSVFQEETSTFIFPPAQGKADNAVSVLEGWLDNIRRIKACR